MSALIGGTITHFLSLNRERASKRRELVTKYMIEIWQTIESANRSKEANTLKRLERPFADIQLFGSDETVELAREAVNGIAEGQGADVTKLLNNLRDNLRKELGLKHTESKFFSFRSQHKD
jgi:hypothetical protein